MNQAFNLFQLQKIDTQIDQINTRLAEIVRSLAEDEAIRQAEAALKEAQGCLEQAKRALRKVEDEVQANRIKLETVESNLYSGRIQNPKELKDLQNETAALKRRAETLEDQQLEAMIELETAETKHKAANATLTQAQGDLASKNAGLLGEQSQLKHNLERLQSERSAALGLIQEDSLKVYLGLRRQKRGVAVAQIDDGACTGCGSTLTPAEWQAARSPSQVVYCSSCGRILYAG